MPANVSIPRQTRNATLTWGQNFVTKLEAAPATYMVAAVTITALRTLVDAFQIAFDVAGVVGRLSVDPSGYTKPQRAALSAAAADFLGLASQTAVQIQANSAISDMDKLDAGVVPRNFTRTPIPAPNSAPLIDISFAASGTHQLEYADTNSPSSRTKPSGVTGLLLFLEIHAGNVDADYNNARLYGVFTKSPMIVAFDQDDAGKTATYWAQWINRRGEPGPLSASRSFTIAIGD